MKKVKKNLRSASVLVMALLFISIPMVYHCGTPTQESKAPDAAIKKNKKPGSPGRAAKLPMIVDSWVMIPIKVNNSRPLHLILDTGMTHGNVLLSLSKEEIEHYGFKDLQTTYIGGAGAGNPTKTFVAGNATVEIADNVFTNQQLLIMDRDRDAPFYVADGVIGKELVFDKHVVEIDLENEFLYLHKPESFTPPEGWTEIPVEFDLLGRIYFYCDITITGEKHIRPRLLVDTGNAYSPLDLLLNPNENIHLPLKSIDSIASRGLSGEIKGSWGRTAEVTLGGHKLTNVLTAFSHPRQRRIKRHMVGFELLERFNLIFDYHRKRMFIKPNRFYKKPFEITMAGFLMRRAGNGTRSIYKLLPDSCAKKAGLQSGDIILEVNGQPATTMKSRRLRDIFTEEGKTVDIKIQRGSKQLLKHIKLKRLL
jgi:hypothetical protein